MDKGSAVTSKNEIEFITIPTLHLMWRNVAVVLERTMVSVSFVS